MLQAGFHRTFSELHQLMTQQATNREKAGPDSALWGEPLLSTENDKLESIKYYLTEAEEALRAGKPLFLLAIGHCTDTIDCHSNPF